METRSSRRGTAATTRTWRVTWSWSERARPTIPRSSSATTFFFFNDTAPTEIYTSIDTLSLHDALPISVELQRLPGRAHEYRSAGNPRARRGKRRASGGYRGAGPPRDSARDLERGFFGQRKAHPRIAAVQSGIGLTTLFEKQAAHTELFDQLQVEGNAHAVDEHDALVEQLLVGDFRIDEFLKLGARADELDGFGGFLGRRRKLVKHGKV